MDTSKIRYCEVRDCEICFDTMKGCAVLECGHSMCISCCLKHFKEQDSCPFCRKQITNKNETNSDNDSDSHSDSHIDSDNHSDNDSDNDSDNHSDSHSESESDSHSESDQTINLWTSILTHFEKNRVIYEILSLPVLISYMLFTNYEVSIKIIMNKYE